MLRKNEPEIELGNSITVDTAFLLIPLQVLDKAFRYARQAFLLMIYRSSGISMDEKKKNNSKTFNNIFLFTATSIRTARYMGLTSSIFFTFISEL